MKVKQLNIIVGQYCRHRIKRNIFAKNETENRKHRGTFSRETKRLIFSILKKYICTIKLFLK